MGYNDESARGREGEPISLALGRERVKAYLKRGRPRIGPTEIENA